MLPDHPHRENLVRAVYPSVELRANDDEPDGPPMLEGHFAKFNEWAEIDSVFEGRFLERIAPGAFKRTFTNNREHIRTLFQHGQDPVVGDKPLGSIEVLEEDEEGARYAVNLLDTSYNRDLIPGLKAGLYGSSFRFSIPSKGDHWDDKPRKSAHNPNGLPERTINEARVFEFGPVTFPAYAGATASVRSLTDIYNLKQFVREPEKLGELLDSMRAEALPGPDASHSDEGTRQATEPVSPTPQLENTPMPDPAMPVEQREARQTEIRSRLEAIDTDHAGSDLPDETQREWNALNEELAANQKVLDAVAQRRQQLAAIAEAKPTTVTRFDDGYEPPQVRVKPGADIYDTQSIHSQARSQHEEVRLLRDNAKRANEIASFPGTHDRSAAQAHVEWLLDNVVEPKHEQGSLARRILNTGRPGYDTAFGKALAGQPLDNEEARALSLTAGAGGNAVTFDLDPSIMGTSTRQVNPIRQLARVIPITGDEWRGVTSGAITTGFAAEATEATDNAPSLTQPAISTEKAFAWVPFSIEIDMDWAGMRSEMSQLLQESKDDLEAVKFTTGTGTNEPFGVLVGATTTVNATTGQTTDAEDFYRLTAALPERYQPRAAILANRAIYNLVRQFVLTGQSNPWKDLEDPTITEGRAGTLLGYPAYMNSAMVGTTTTGSLFAIIGDFSRFVIVDRVGLNVEVVQHVVGANQRPTGQRGLYAYWRVGSKVINADAFRVLIGIA